MDPLIPLALALLILLLHLKPTSAMEGNAELHADDADGRRFLKPIRLRYPRSNSVHRI